MALLFAGNGAGWLERNFKLAVIVAGHTVTIWDVASGNEKYIAFVVKVCYDTPWLQITVTVIISFKQKKGRRIVMSDNFNMYDQANQQGNPNIPPMPPMEEKKGMSIASMVLGIIGLVFWCIPILGGPIGIVGLILGIVGRKKGGRGMATAGIVMSIITIVLAVINAIAGVYLQTSNVLNQL